MRASIRPTLQNSYLHNGARWMHGYHGPPIGSHQPRVKWSCDRRVFHCDHASILHHDRDIAI